jgi:hypothetical protein
MFVQCGSPTWLWVTVWYCWPSTYQRSWLGLTLRSHSKLYVWKAAWHVLPGHARLAPRPLFSLHGPPGATPQCSTPHTELMPLTFSMMSNSPMRGQLYRSLRYGAPSAQNAGQYPAAAAPVTLGIWIRPSMRSTPPAGALKSVRWVSIRADVHCPALLRIGVIRRLPEPSWLTFAVLLVYVWISPVPHCGGPPG